MINIAGNDITDIAVGSTPIEKAYIGSQLVWSRGPEPLYDAEIQYLQGTGSTYIDLGIIGDNSLDYEVKFLWPSGQYQYVLGSQTSDSSNRFSIMNGTGSNRRIYCNSGNSSNQKSYVLTPTDKSNPVIVEKSGNNVLINGVQRLTFASQTYTTPSTITLFACHEGSTLRSFYVGRIYYIKIGNLDLVPVRKKNVGYMYDKNSGLLYGNASTGSFTLGPDVT